MSAGLSSTTPPSKEQPHINNNVAVCVSCTSGDFVKAHCSQCGYLCDNCRMAHQFMHCFEGHEVKQLATSQSIAQQQLQKMEKSVSEATKKQQEMLETFRFIDEAQSVLHTSHQQSISAVHETTETLINVIQEMRQLLIKDLEAKFDMKQLALAVLDKESFFEMYDANVDSVGKILNQMDSVHPLSREACIPDVLHLFSESGFDVSSLITKFGGKGGSSRTSLTLPSSNDLPAPVGAIGDAPFDNPWNNDNAQTDADNQMYQLYPPRSQIKRQKMIYYCKFGEFGVIEGQFTEPSGVAVNCQNDIIVADTNNHRIQVFDREGRFKFQFGECGKRDGQLLYPNRVSVNRVTGDFIVTERSPTHQIQIFNQYGQFMRKFGANILQHPRGVCVDHQGRIIVVECKVMRVIIFDSYGNVLQKFSCSRYLEFPNGVCATPNNEILISDNRAHCIKVFSYEGQYLRQIGGEGITNYPIGVGINGNGEVIVADNHNNFNLTIFDQKGNMLNALESKVKHAQCFDMALVDDGSVVLASKDYRLYLYRYSHPLTV